MTFEHNDDIYTDFQDTDFDFGFDATALLEAASEASRGAAPAASARAEKTNSLDVPPIASVPDAGRRTGAEAPAERSVGQAALEALAGKPTKEQFLKNATDDFKAAVKDLQDLKDQTRKAQDAKLPAPNGKEVIGKAEKRIETSISNALNNGVSPEELLREANKAIMPDEITGRFMIKSADSRIEAGVDRKVEFTVIPPGFQLGDIGVNGFTFDATLKNGKWSVKSTDSLR